MTTNQTTTLALKLITLCLLACAPVAAQDVQITEAGSEIAERASESKWASLGDAYPEIRNALVTRWNALAVAESVQGQPAPARAWKNFKRDLLTLEKAILKRVAELENRY